MPLILSDRPTKPTKVRIQIRNRGDGKNRYSCNLPKGFMDRIISKFQDKKGVYVINCIHLVIEDGEAFLRIDETKEMI